MADTCTMSELLEAPTEGYGDAIVLPAILAKNFELKVGLLTLVTSSHFHGFERDDPHSHIRWFNKITSTLKYKNVPHDAIKLMLFPFSLEVAARIWLEKEPPRSIHTWEDLVSNRGLMEHLVRHGSMSDETLAIPLDKIQIDDKLHFIEKPVKIMDREVKRLKQSRIPIVKVRWNSRRGHEFTWEREDQM
ncbi:hypothetical protein Tco_0233322 [Tanacetum coccineum]